MDIKVVCSFCRKLIKTIDSESEEVNNDTSHGLCKECESEWLRSIKQAQQFLKFKQHPK